MGKWSPINYILLFIFTITFTLPMMVICLEAWNYVLLALGLTFAVCFALVVYSLITQSDFTIIGGGLAVAIVIILVLSLIGIFIPKDYYKPFQLVISGISLFVFGLYLVYDL